jgi:hypothetical protein
MTATFKTILASLPNKDTVREALATRFVHPEIFPSWFGERRRFRYCHDFSKEFSLDLYTDKEPEKALNEDHQLFRDWISHRICEDILADGIDPDIDPALEYRSIRYLIYFVLREVNWEKNTVQLVDLFALAQQVFSLVKVNHYIDTEGYRYMTLSQLHRAVDCIRRWMN